MRERKKDSTEEKWANCCHCDFCLFNLSLDMEYQRGTHTHKTTKLMIMNWFVVPQCETITPKSHKNVQNILCGGCDMKTYKKSNSLAVNTLDA